MAHKFSCEHCGEEVVLRAVGPLGRAMCRACGRRTAVPDGVVPAAARRSPVPPSASAAKAGHGATKPAVDSQPNQGPLRLLAKIQFALVVVIAVPQTLWTIGTVSSGYTGMMPFGSLLSIFIIAYTGLGVWLSWLIRGALLAVADGLDDLKAIRRSLDA